MGIDFSFSIPELIILIVTICVVSILSAYWLYLYRAPMRYIQKSVSGKIPYTDELPPVSVIVYAKDSADYLTRFLKSYLTQNYPKYEVIVVIDGISDSSRDVVANFALQYDNLVLSYIPDDACNVSHKKLGITLGIKAARYDHLVITQANCRPAGKEWLSSLCRNFTPETEIVIGYTPFQYESSESEPRYHTFDRTLSSLRYLAFGSIGRPYRANGYNIAYKKDLFFANKGFSRTLNLHAGDDDLFINQIATGTNTRVELSPESRTICEVRNEHAHHRIGKLTRTFTARQLKTPAKKLFRLQSVAEYMLLASFISAWFFGIGNPLFLAIILLLCLTAIAIQIIVFRQGARLLDTAPGYLLLPLFLLIKPWVNLRYELEVSRRKFIFYTWHKQHL